MAASLSNMSPNSVWADLVGSAGMQSSDSELSAGSSSSGKELVSPFQRLDLRSPPRPSAEESHDVHSQTFSTCAVVRFWHAEQGPRMAPCKLVLQYTNASVTNTGIPSKVQMAKVAVESTLGRLNWRLFRPAWLCAVAVRTVRAPRLVQARGAFATSALPTAAGSQCRYPVQFTRYKRDDKSFCTSTVLVAA